MSRQFVPSGTKIMCTNAPGEAIEIKATNSTVTIYGENWLTTKDNVPGVNFKLLPFAACSNICKVPCAVIKDEWDIPASDKIQSNNKKLLADDSVLQCDIGGEISLMMQCVGDMADPPNTLDVLKETLNSTFKAVIKQVEALTGGVAGTIAATVGDIAAPIAGAINSKAVQTALKVGQGYLANAQKLKDNVDKHIETAELNTEGLSEYIEEHVGGAEANVTDLVYDVTDELQQELDALLNNVEDTINQNLNDIKKGINNLGSSVTNANPQFNSLLNFLSETRRADQVVEANSEGPLYHVDENSTSNVSDAHRIDGTKPHNFEIDTSKLNDLQDQLSAQTQEIRDELSTEIAKLEALIERYSLNNYLQRKIDEELERRIEKAKKESEELQTDMDRASTLLYGLGNEYTAFVTGFSNQLIDKFNSKIDPKLVEAQNKLKVANANMTTAAGALNGLKFIAGGMPAGLVVTKAKPKNKKGDREDSVNDSLVSLLAIDGNTTEDNEKNTDAKLGVEFRPTPSYNGNFGFDWLRIGDTNFSDDKDFGLIMGDYNNTTAFGQNDYLNEFFEPDDSKYEEMKALFNPIPHPFLENENYYTPIMTLFKGKSAKLQLITKFNDSDIELELDFNENYFKINKVLLIKQLMEIANSSSKEGEITMTIRCKKEFSNSEFIKIKNKKDDKLVGQLKILPNDSPKNINILFIKIKTKLPVVDIEDDFKESFGSIKTGFVNTNAKNIIKKTLGMSYVKVSDFKEIELDLTDNYDINNQYAHSRGARGLRLEFMESSSLNLMLTNTFKDQDLRNYNKYKEYYKFYIFNEKIYSLNDYYKRDQDNEYYKVDYNPTQNQHNFIIENGKKVKDIELLGRAFGLGAREKSSIIFHRGINANDRTLAHELFHAIGIPHTFLEKNDYQEINIEKPYYTFKQKETLNLMDYQLNDKAIFTYNWQWAILNSLLEN